MMKSIALLALPVALLAACSPGPVALQPGMWETTVQFTSVDLPGASPQELAQMRAMMARPQSHAECITPEQAANPMQRMMNQSGDPHACQFGDSSFADGVIRVHGTCQAPSRGTAVTNLQGTFTATTMQANISSEIHPPAGTPGPQSARMSGTLSAHRTGDCPS